MIWSNTRLKMPAITHFVKMSPFGAPAIWLKHLLSCVCTTAPGWWSIFHAWIPIFQALWYLLEAPYFPRRSFLCPVIIFSAGLNSFLSVCGVYKAHIKLHEYTGLKQLPNPEKCIFLVWQLKRQAKYRWIWKSVTSLEQAFIQS